MRIEEFEKKLRESSGAQQDEVDTDTLWSEVSGQLNKKKKRRIMPFWIWGIFVVISIASIPFLNEFSNLNSEKQDAQSLHLVQNSTQSESAKIVLTREQKEHIQSINTVDEEIQDLNSNMGLSKSNEVVGDFKIQDTNIASDIDQSETGGINKDELNQNFGIVKSLDKSNDEWKKLLPDEAGVASGELSKEVFQLAPINPINFNVLERNLSIEVPAYDHQYKGNDENKLWLGISGGLSRWGSIRKNLGQDFNPMAEYRDAVTEELLAWSVQLNMKKQLNNHLSIISGIALQKKYSRGQALIVSNEEVQLNNVLVERITGPDGVTEIYGPATVTQRVESLRTRIYRQSRLSVPFKLQYNFSGHSWSPYLSAGIYASFFQSSSGFLHFVEGAEYDASIDELDRINNSIAFMPEFEVGLEYRIGDQMKFLVGLPYRFSLSSNFSKSMLLAERDFYFGLRLGALISIH